jgi:alkylmercury lyase
MTTAEVQRTVSFFRQQLGLPDLVPRLYRLLADGPPVSVERVAAAGGWRVEQVQAELDRHPGVDWENDGQIAGFGLTLHTTPHKFTFDGGTVFGFCASDALQFPIVLGRPGVIESACPITGESIRVEATPHSVVGVEPAQAVVSKVRPVEAVADVRAEVCSLGLMFSSPGVATGWLERYPQGQLATVAEEFEIVRQVLSELGWAAP